MYQTFMAFYFHFNKLYNNQTYLDGRPAFTKLALRVMMISPPLGRAINVYDIVSKSVIVATTKLCTIEDQHTFPLASR